MLNCIFVEVFRLDKIAFYELKRGEFDADLSKSFFFELRLMKVPATFL